MTCLACGEDLVGRRHPVPVPEALLPEQDPLLQMMARAEVLLPESEVRERVADAVTAERDRIAVSVRDLRDSARRLAKLTGDGYLSLGYQAQDEALSSVLDLLGAES